MIPALIVFAYLAIVVHIGVFAFRRARGKAEVEDYFLANRSLGPYIFLMSLFGTNMTAFVGSHRTAAIRNSRATSRRAASLRAPRRSSDNTTAE